MAVRYWIGVVSRDHVMNGVAGGFAQVGHGKGAPLRRMSAGDWLVYYSPKITFGEDAPCKAFTAIGRIADGDVRQVTMAEDFQPFRRDVAFVACVDAPIAPLLDRLSFTAGTRNWGFTFRRGHFEIPEADFLAIADAMQAHLDPAPVR